MTGHGSNHGRAVVIALVGPEATGKSTIAGELGSSLAVKPLRACGS